MVQVEEEGLVDGDCCGGEEDEGGRKDVLLSKGEEGCVLMGVSRLSRSDRQTDIQIVNHNTLRG